MLKKDPVPAHMHRITAVFVEELFGLHTYDITVGSSSGEPSPSLLILYGDNGTGKTTILHLVYHLLAAESARGHRSYLAKVPFRRLRVTLDPRTYVEAYRSGPELTGAYRLTISRGGETVARAEATVDSELTVKAANVQGTPAQREQWRSFMRGLASLGLTFFFLTDDRRSDELPDATIPPEGMMDPEAYLWHTYRVRRSEGSGTDRRIETIVDRLEKWIRDEALKATNIGEAGTHSVYADVAKRIAQTRRPGRPGRAVADRLTGSLVSLESRSKPFASLGLISPPHLTEILDALAASRPATRALIANVVAPYVDSLRARLDALESIQQLVTLFLERINTFFQHKTVSYQLAHGVGIRTPQGQRLEPSQLSSGERQLLALLAQVLTARGTASVFLIDEPEISLNVKWQRVLVDTLLQLVRGTEVQFILATHSLELLATHRDHVHRLASIGQSSDQAH